MSFRKRVRQQRQKEKIYKVGTPSLTTSQRGILSILKRRSDQKNQPKNNKQKTKTPKTIETIVKVDLIEVKLNKKV